MPLLWTVTLLWAFSFSLIGVYLAGQVDSYFSVLTRVALAFLVFCPLLFRHKLTARLKWRLMAIGAVQLGLMYLFYYKAFSLLSVPEILVFTVFTPVYVTLIYDALTCRFHRGYLIAASLAVAGAVAIRQTQLSDDYWVGFFVVQGANICFASGQVFYKRLVAAEPELQAVAQYQIFGWFFLGALLVALPVWLWLGGDALPTSGLQWLVLAWLGVGASGLGYYLWNAGATRVTSGQLATMNNLLIPAGLLVNILIWNQDTDILRLLIGSLAMIAALAVARPASQPENKKRPQGPLANAD